MHMRELEKNMNNHTDYLRYKEGLFLQLDFPNFLMFPLLQNVLNLVLLVKLLGLPLLRDLLKGEEQSLHQ